MKKIFTLAAILFSITTFAADPRPGKLAIRSNSDAFIQVVVDGKQYNLDRNGFIMDNIRPGRHRVEVYQVNRYGMFRRRPQMIYSSTTFVKPWESLSININRFERVMVDSRSDHDDRYNGGGYANGRDWDRNHDNDRDRDRGNDRGYGDRDDNYRH